jgi:hypothetical protein
MYRHWVNQLTKRERRESQRFKENLQLVEIYRERPLRHMRTLPTVDVYSLGDAFAKLTARRKNQISILRETAKNTKVGYALPPKKNR